MEIRGRVEYPRPPVVKTCCKRVVQGLLATFVVNVRQHICDDNVSRRYSENGTVWYSVVGYGRDVMVTFAQCYPRDFQTRAYSMHKLRGLPWPKPVATLVSW